MSPIGAIHAMMAMHHLFPVFLFKSLSNRVTQLGNMT